ncbi:Phosphoadenosine phosphosulfate reductase [Brevundimonas sp. SH203]|uniref:phosphoadenylyl-sulfate reductase n=1 Tax=Brevundimonas sp. SH203 TaxID=345167 RepID=UPI0009CA3813|nr:phosphoadenylyl-sulfate reductase [Brevundimonas sp. SH203]GAW40591.1 Phosphoadenosine phosphosulfate reductase [Brevundimonas sp. SH203]
MLQTLEGIQNGLRLSVTTPLDDVETAAASEDVLVLEFEAFRDGRGFTLASVLRERGYGGRLIAAGKLLPDQARHLRRSGFDAVELAPGADAAAWARMDQAFSAAYQPATDAAPTIWRRRQASNDRDLAALAERLNHEVKGQSASEIIRAALDPALGLRVGAISSFGAESAALLHIIAEERPETPVVFLETGQHFLQTLSYRTQLTKALGLSDVRLVTPDAGEKAALDARDDLWRIDADACCDLRKVRPLARATAGFNALITGRKRYQAATRARLKPFEVLDGVLRINPLANWDADDVEAWLDDHDLPRHPLVEQGYASIGCWPCTRAVQTGEDARAGRWSGMDKVECGIHLGKRQAAA